MTKIKTNPIIQCSVYWVDFDPVVGTEAGKTQTELRNIQSAIKIVLELE